jgi:hypothetical protein
MHDLSCIVANLSATCNRTNHRTVPGTAVSLLTSTSKMPSASWSLPARKSCPRANGTICASCYGCKNCYRYKTTRNAQYARFAWTVESMQTPEGRKQWVEHMVGAIRQSGCEYFRIHDSGDMFSPVYSECWYEICKAMPDVKFWIPTRSWQQPCGPLPLHDPLLSTLRKLAGLPNVTVRPSALNFGDYAPAVPGLHAGSTAAMPDVFRAFQCPAAKQGGMCADCRVCWDEKDLPVNYPKH